MAVSFDPIKQETIDFGILNSGTSNSVFSSVELEIGAIILFKVISWCEVTLLLIAIYLLTGYPVRTEKC